MHHDSSRSTEPLAQERQAEVFVAVSRHNRCTRFDQMLLHVRPEVRQQFDFLAQHGWVLIHRVVKLVSVAFDVLDGST